MKTQNRHSNTSNTLRGHGDHSTNSRNFWRTVARCSTLSLLSIVVSLAWTCQAQHYVDAAGTNPVSPYSDWTTAATNIQDAVDASVAGDQVFVTNGVYQFGGRIVYGSSSNRVAITQPITVASINGPAVTVIQGN
jgi:hypothetical protein